MMELLKTNEYWEIYTTIFLAAQIKFAFLPFPA